MPPTRVEKNLTPLSLYSGVLRSKVAAAINQANETVHDVAQQLAPVSEDGSHGNPPGYLRDHIVITKEATPEDLTAATEAEAYYSIYVEHGTVESEAQPFMSPAAEMGKRQLKEDLSNLGTSRVPAGAIKTNI